MRKEYSASYIRGVLTGESRASVEDMLDITSAVNSLPARDLAVVEYWVKGFPLSGTLARMNIKENPTRFLERVLGMLERKLNGGEEDSPDGDGAIRGNNDVG